MTGGLENGNQNDWITNFLAETSQINSPEIFRLWTAISCLSGAMEKKYWSSWASGPIFPNTFILLLGPPGCGKSQAVELAKNLWRGTKYLHVAPDSLSKASLIDAVADSYHLYNILPQNEIIEFNALNIAIDELGVLLPEYESGMVSQISAFYDSRADFSEKKRSFGLSNKITSPMLNCLFGGTVGFLKQTLPEVAWTQGFMSRFIMVYSAEAIKMNLRGIFNKSEFAKYKFSEELRGHLNRICEYAGVFYWEEETQEEFIKWYEGGMPPQPAHPRLIHYNTRRMLHCAKLMMVSCISRGTSLKILPFDFSRALSWMLDSEAAMPEIFRAMGGRGDKEIILDLHAHLISLQLKYGVSEVPLEIAFDHISGLVQAERVEKVLALGQAMGLLERKPRGISAKAVKQLTLGDKNGDE
jgi:energy-coupling factor transporter ATP-binding protein EcfA2